MGAPEMGAAAPLRARPAPALPLAELLLGQSVEDAAALLPRLFNLCRVAQETAARAAFGLDLAPDWQAQLRAEILRDHMVKLCLTWPAALGHPPLALPDGWPEGSRAARIALFGREARLPQEPAELAPFMAQPSAISTIYQSLSERFPMGNGCRGALPLSHSDGLFTRAPQENSVAARQAAHPVMAAIEARWGRGPLWSAMGVAYDLEALWHDELPAADLRPGRAVVPAARGLYGLRAEIRGGQIRAFARITPTDHLLARGGALEQSLARLPAQGAAEQGALLLSFLDPCHPVRLEPRAEEAPQHA